MELFDFIKKKEKDILASDTGPTEVPPGITYEVDKINWAGYQTAYGNAEKTIPHYLKNLFCKDIKISMEATHQLWCSLCHQHAYISSAALPSYDILKTGLLQLNDKLKIELLDIFLGFANCSNPSMGYANKERWELELRQKLIDDIDLFKGLSQHANKEISDFAQDIFKDLSQDIDSKAI